MTEYLTKFGTQAYSLVTGEEKQKEWHEELEESICGKTIIFSYSHVKIFDGCIRILNQIVTFYVMSDARCNTSYWFVGR